MQCVADFSAFSGPKDRMPCSVWQTSSAFSGSKDRMPCRRHGLISIVNLLIQLTQLS